MGVTGAQDFTETNGETLQSTSWKETTDGITSDTAPRTIMSHQRPECLS